VKLLALRLLEEPRHAGNRAAGADARHEDVDLTFRVVPDFGACRPQVNLGVGGILELLRHEVLGVLRHLLGPGHCAPHPFGCRREHEVGTEPLEQLPPLDRHRLRHQERERIALRGTDEGQRDPGVATGRLDDVLAGLEPAGAFGVPDHRRADAALDAVGGIAAFDFGKNSCVQAAGEAVDLDERRPADGVDVIWKNRHGEASCLQSKQGAPPRCPVSNA